MLRMFHSDISVNIPRRYLKYPEVKSLQETWYDPDYDEICTLEKLPKDRLWRSQFSGPVPLNWDRQMASPTMSAATCCYLICKCSVLAELCPAVQASIAQALHWHETRTWRVPRKCK